MFRRCLSQSSRGLLSNDLSDGCDAPKPRHPELYLDPINLNDYLKLLDVSGRMVRSGKAFQPASAILNRLGIISQHWLELIADFESLFGSVVWRPQAPFKTK